MPPVKSIHVRVFPLPILGFVLVASLASADPSPAQKAVASQFFDDAEALMASGKPGDACPKYAESQRLDPQLGTLLHLADCYEKVGKTASAWTTFKDAVEIASQRKDGREGIARSRVANLDGKLPKLVVTLAGKAPKDIELRQDGEVVGSASFGAPVPVDPGKHTVTAKAVGYKAWSTSVDVPAGAGSTRVVVPELEPEAAELASPAPLAPAPVEPAPTALAATAPPPSGPVSAPPPAQPPASDRGSTQRTIGYVVGGAGVVGLAVGAIFGFKSKSKASNREDVCGPAGLCTTTAEVDEINRLSDEARSAGTVASVSLAVGGAALATGIVLLLTAPSGEPKAAGAIDVRPWVGPGVAGAALGGAW
jgi:hypothetical protein